MSNRGRELLAALRRDRTRWTEVEYAEAARADDDPIDLNCVARHRVLKALQHDRRAEDEALVRHLFEQEYRCRARNADGSSYDSLYLAGYLLGTFRVSDDIWLFWRVKRVNFDVGSSFDEHLMFACGVRETYAYLRASQHPSRDAVLDYLGPEAECEVDLAHCRAAWQAYFPTNEADVPLSARLWDAIDWGDRDEALALFQQWQAGLPKRDARTLGQIVRTSEALGLLDVAIDAQREVVTLVRDDEWKTIGEQTTLAKLLLRAQRPEAAWHELQLLAPTLDRYQRWKGCGLGREVVETLLDLGLALGGAHALTPAVLAWAVALVRRGSSASPRMAGKGVQLAQSLADGAREAFFAALADALALRP